MINFLTRVFFVLCQQEQYFAVWPALMAALVNLIELPEEEAHDDSPDQLIDEEDVGNTFAALAFASKQVCRCGRDVWCACECVRARMMYALLARLCLRACVCMPV